MEKKPQDTQQPDTANDTSHVKHVNEEPAEKEVDVDSKIHETSPDLIQKESHRLPVDDEVKKG